MKLIDLTHPIASDMPVYPGTEPPVLITACAIDDAGFLEKKITLYSHTGTHVDAPAHLLKGAKTLDRLPIAHFYGKALLLNCAGLDSRSMGLEIFEPHGETIKQVDFLLLHTGWHQYWGEQTYFSGYPVLSLEAADWLSRFALKGLGLDTISADAADSRDFPVHKLFLHNDMIIIENLTNLERLPCNQFIFSCFPLRLADADGSPVRALAFIS